jgi:hypothetical protein
MFVLRADYAPVRLLRLRFEAKIAGQRPQTTVIVVILVARAVGLIIEEFE